MPPFHTHMSVLTSSMVGSGSISSVLSWGLGQTSTFIWVNYTNSLPWIVRPFLRGWFPYKNRWFPGLGRERSCSVVMSSRSWSAPPRWHRGNAAPPFAPSPSMAYFLACGNIFECSVCGGSDCGSSSFFVGIAKSLAPSNWWLMVYTLPPIKMVMRLGGMVPMALL